MRIFRKSFRSRQVHMSPYFNKSPTQLIFIADFHHNMFSSLSTEVAHCIRKNTKNSTLIKGHTLHNTTHNLNEYAYLESGFSHFRYQFSFLITKAKPVSFLSSNKLGNFIIKEINYRNKKIHIRFYRVKTYTTLFYNKNVPATHNTSLR